VEIWDPVTNPAHMDPGVEVLLFLLLLLLAVGCFCFCPFPLVTTDVQRDLAAYKEVKGSRTAEMLKKV
jgi:hypothetical protein